MNNFRRQTSAKFTSALLILALAVQSVPMGASAATVTEQQQVGQLRKDIAALRCVLTGKCPTSLSFLPPLAPLSENLTKTAGSTVSVLPGASTPSVIADTFFNTLEVLGDALVYSKAPELVELADAYEPSALEFWRFALISLEYAEIFADAGQEAEANEYVSRAHRYLGMKGSFSWHEWYFRDEARAMTELKVFGIDLPSLGIEIVIGPALKGAAVLKLISKKTAALLKIMAEGFDLGANFALDLGEQEWPEATKQMLSSAITKVVLGTKVKAFGNRTLADELTRKWEKLSLTVSGEIGLPTVEEFVQAAIKQPEVQKNIMKVLEQAGEKATEYAVKKLTKSLLKQTLTFVGSLFPPDGTNAISRLTPESFRVAQSIPSVLIRPAKVSAENLSAAQIVYRQVAMMRGQLQPAVDAIVAYAKKQQGTPAKLSNSANPSGIFTPATPTSIVPPSPSLSSPPLPPQTSLQVVPSLPAPSPSVVQPPAPTFSGNAPELIGATFVCDERPHIDLQWSSVRDANRYTLWRNYDWKGLIMAPGTNFRDQSINSNSMYEYWVVAERAGVKGKISNSITVKVPECSMFTAKLHAYPVGAGPYRVKTGDLNGDGHTDIVTANYLNSSVSVLLGDGRGAFESAINTDVGIGPIEPFVFDINGDHLDDIVVSNSAGTTTVLLANRDGSLKKVQTITGYISAAVDFDRDHRLDLFGAFGNWPSTWHNAVLRNNGTGTFDEVTTWRRSEQVLERATAGDFDGNGKPDVIGVVARTKGTVVFLSGNGDGTFGAPEERPLALAAEGQFSQTAHFTVGSAADAIVSTGSAFTVLSGGPGGPAREAKALPTGLDSVGVGLVNQLGFADLDRDGRDDVIVPDPTNGQVKIQLTTQTAGDMELGSFPVGARPTAAVVADFNEDGKDDIAVANNGSATVSVLLSGEQLNIAVAKSLEASAKGGSSSGGQDDKKESPPTVPPPPPPPPAPILAYELFKSSVSYGVGGSPQSITLGDFNGDGAKDIAAANYNGNSISVLLAKGDGTFAPAVTSPVGRATFGIFSGNLNGDGKDDLIVGDSYEKNYALVSNGDGTFRQTAVLPGYVQGAGDFNGDGKLDAFMAGNDNRVYLGNGDGAFRESPWRRKSWMLQRIAVGDFNGDGKVDVAGTADPWPERSDRRPVVLLLGNGDGTFDGGHQWDLAKFHRMQWTATGDFNADGKKDLVVAHKAMSVLLGSGAGDFGAPIDFQIGTDGRTKTDVMFTETGDFNSDGRDDVVVPNAPDGSIMVRLTDPAGLGSGDTGTFPVGSAPIAIAVGDLNKDGKLDLAIVNSGSNDVSVLLHR